MKKSLQILLFIFVLAGLTFAQSDIKEVDFSNFTYQPMCGNSQAQSMTVTKGIFYEEKDVTPPAPANPPKDKNGNPIKLPKVYERKYFKPFQTIYGDLNGDEINEAIVLTTCSRGGIESYTEGFIYGMKDGKPELLTRIEGGDRASGGLRSVKIEKDSIIVERSRPGLTGDSCCAEFAETTRYKFSAGGLTTVGEKTSVELYPPTRLQIAEGRNVTSLNLEIPRSDEFKRFVISGQKGQTVKISTSSADARLRLFKGNAKLILVPKPANNLIDYVAQNVLTVELKETGDYIFEVSNLSKENVVLNVTVRVEIN